MNDNWIDILPPVPPAESLPAWVWLLIAVFIVVVSLIYLWQQSARQKSLKELKTLHAQLKNNDDIHSIPFAVSNTLKKRFDVTNINQVVMQDTAGWQDYKNRLLTACFSKQKPDPTEINELLSEVTHWLSQVTVK